MTWVKLCGLRTADDVAAAVAAGADAVGFVIAPVTSIRQRNWLTRVAENEADFPGPADLEADLVSLEAYAEFRREAASIGMRHFLEVFNPNAPSRPFTFSCKAGSCNARRAGASCPGSSTR